MSFGGSSDACGQALREPVGFLHFLVHQLLASGEQFLELLVGRVGGGHEGEVGHLSVVGEDYGVYGVGLGLVAHCVGEAAHLVGRGYADAHVLASQMAHQRPLVSARGFAYGDGGSFFPDEPEQRGDAFGSVVEAPGRTLGYGHHQLLLSYVYAGYYFHWLFLHDVYCSVLRTCYAGLYAHVSVRSDFAARGVSYSETAQHGPLPMLTQ